jgi:inosine-uridine nucleoside N-ribohydrolase
VSVPGSRRSSRRPVFVDTDIGCDDALAVAWLLQEPEADVIGFSTVFGNSSVQDTTRNLLTLLAALGVDLPVTMGATAPLVYPRTSSGALVHGPDGLWGAQQAHALDQLRQDAPGALAAAARANPDLTIIALGPLTNIARAVQAFPDDMAGVRLVALGGAKAGGNATPVAEFNIFADPHALEVVLNSTLRLELITLDAFQYVLIDPSVLGPQLAHEAGPAGAVLAQALMGYGAAQTQGAGGPVPIPDAAAVVYAIYPALGTPEPAAVRVVLDGEYTRGQTIVAATFAHRVSLGLGASGVARLGESAAAAGFDLAAIIHGALERAAVNAQVVSTIDAPSLLDRFVAGLLGLARERSVGA